MHIGTNSFQFQKKSIDKHNQPSAGFGVSAEKFMLCVTSPVGHINLGNFLSQGLTGFLYVRFPLSWFAGSVNQPNVILAATLILQGCRFFLPILSYSTYSQEVALWLSHTVRASFAIN